VERRKGGSEGIAMEDEEREVGGVRKRSERSAVKSGGWEVRGGGMDGKKERREK